MPNRLPKLSNLVIALCAVPATVLAQSSPLAAEAPTPLPSPPTLVHYTLESPTLLMVTLLCAALIAFLVLNSRGKAKQAGVASGALIALAAGLWVLARVVTTDREKVLALTKALVTSTASADIGALDANLTRDAALFMPMSRTEGTPKPEILNRVSSALGKNGLAQVTDHAVLEAQVQIVSPNLAYVQTYVRVTAGGTPFLSWWRLDAKPDEQGAWRVSGIQYLSSNFPIQGF